MATSYSIISNYLANKLLDRELKGIDYTMPSNTYLALYTNTTGAGNADSGNEKTVVGGYSRVILPSFSITGTTAYNTTGIAFSEATGNWGAIYGWGIKDALTGGNLLLWGLFNTYITINSGNSLKIKGNDFIIKLAQTNATSGGWSSGAASTLLYNMLSGDTIPQSPYAGTTVALVKSVSLTTDKNLSGYAEVSSVGGYTRQALNAPDWSTASGKASHNISDIVFTTGATANWGTITDTVIFSMYGSLFWGHLQSPAIVNTGDKFMIEAGALNVQLY